MRQAADGRSVELVDLNSSGQRPVRVRVEHTVPFSTGVPSGGERTGLLTGTDGVMDKGQQVSNTTIRLSVCLVSTLVVFILAVIGTAIATYSTASSTISAVTEALGPSPKTTARQAVQNLIEILNHTSLLTGNLARLTDRSDEMLAESQPIVSHALNTSAALLKRLNSFAAHPSISIGGGGLG